MKRINNIHRTEEITLNGRKTKIVFQISGDDEGFGQVSVANDVFSVALQWEGTEKATAEIDGQCSMSAAQLAHLGDMTREVASLEGIARQIHRELVRVNELTPMARELWASFKTEWTITAY